MCDKARERVARELIEQIEKCARATDDKDEYKQLYLYNTKVWGIHNYYCIATDISKDASKIAFRLERVQRNRYRNRLSKTGKPLNRSNIWSDMKKLCESSNVLPEKVYPHNLRHLFARTFYTMQKDIVRLADVLGHSSINTTRLYTMETGEQHQKIIQKLGLVMLLC